jgi:hypothetical protein
VSGARMRLHDLCGYRSGDKGDIVNIALLADDEAAYAVIEQEVTAARVKEHFATMVTGEIVRYEVPNVLALNFVLYGALRGGGPRTLRADNLGKTMGGSLVRMEIPVPDALAGRRAPRPDVAWADAILDPLRDSAAKKRA